MKDNTTAAPQTLGVSGKLLVESFVRASKVRVLNEICFRSSFTVPTCSLFGVIIFKVM